METLTPSLLEWGAAVRALPGEAKSGDMHLIHEFPNGCLAAAVDGLGHGKEAATAAQAAVRELARRAGEPVISLVRSCHEALRKTRGVVLSLASFNAKEREMVWLGVGNVEGVLLRAAPLPGWPRSESLLLRGGVLGGQLPPLVASIVSVLPGDMLVFATDGVGSGFAEGIKLDDPPQRIADRILVRHGKKTDDALVLVARYVGRKP